MVVDEAIIAGYFSDTRTDLPAKGAAIIGAHAD
jgi:hypothetical protein